MLPSAMGEVESSCATQIDSEHHGCYLLDLHYQITWQSSLLYWSLNTCEYRIPLTSPADQSSRACSPSVGKLETDTQHLLRTLSKHMKVAVDPCTLWPVRKQGKRQFWQLIILISKSRQSSTAKSRPSSSK